MTLRVCLVGGRGNLVGRRGQAHERLREALSSLGWTNFGWWLGGFCGKVVAIIVHLVEERRDVGLVVELVVLFDCGACVGKKLVVSVTFALPFGFSFLLFGELGWWCNDVGGNEVHVV